MLYDDIKKRLDAVVEYAYSGDPNIDQYKRYYLDLSERVSKTKVGHYEPTKSLIRVYGCGAFSSAQIIVTCLHELAHHIDSFAHPSKSHGDSFWATYATLLSIALDMKIISNEDIEWYASTSPASDKNKVMAIALSHTVDPHVREYAKGATCVYVYESFAVKDSLKAAGFRYRSQDRSWVIEIEQERVIACQSYLVSLGLAPDNIVIRPASEVYIKGV